MYSIPNIVFSKTKEKKFNFQILNLEELYINKGFSPVFEKNHKIQFNLIMFITSGYGTHYIDNKLYNYSEDNILVVLKDQVHAFGMNKNVKGYAILADDSFFLEHFINSDVLSFMSFHMVCYSSLIILKNESRQYFRSLLQLMNAEYHNRENENQLVALRLLSKYLFLKIVELRNINKEYKNTEGFQRFYTFNELLKKYYIETRDAKEYAKMCSVSYKNLNEICKNYTGYTVKKYIDNYIILEAKRYLLSSDISIKELAYKLGFSETSNFIKYFTNHVNESPVSYKTRY